MSWFDAPATCAAFAGTFVTFLEALTIVLAVGTSRGWRDALGGAVLAIGVLLPALIAVGGEMTRMPLQPSQAASGGLPLLFGMRRLGRRCCAPPG